jgi:exonuclease III
MEMVIIDWNCRQKFWNKYKIFSENKIKWDILVIQECDCPKYVKEKYPDYYNWAIKHQYKWIGDEWDKPQKIGIGIFAKSHVTIEDLRNFFNGEFFEGGVSKKFDWSSMKKELKDTMLRYFLPVLVNKSFILLGIYAKAPKIIKEITYECKNQYEYQYMGQIREYLKNNKEKLVEKSCIATGDFNDNYIFSKEKSDDAKKHFKDVIKLFNAEIKLFSVYHTKNNIEIGKEKNVATRYHNDKKNGIINRPDHIDYFFVSKDLINYSNITIQNEWEEDKTNGNKKWKGLSDHCPIVLELKNM